MKFYAERCPGIWVKRHTSRLPGCRLEKALQCNAFLCLVGCQRHTSRVPGPGVLAGSKRLVNPGARPGAQPGCPARMPGSCVAGLTNFFCTIVYDFEYSISIRRSSLQVSKYKAASKLGNTPKKEN